MCSYPEEYLFHPVPVMAVYGLPIPDEPPAKDLKDSDTDNNSKPPKKTLTSELYGILVEKNEYNLYEATTYLTNPQVPPPFRVIAVPKDYTLPQRQQPHSNLSPLSSESPIHRDGLMTPLWMKRHTYYPSTIIGFYELWYTETEETSRKETGPLASQILLDPTEKEYDMNLANEINTRRKYFQEKGVKFSVVILLKQKNIDPSIEERLFSIRKQCGLDYKGSFFTVAPSTKNELREFINNLYRMLNESASIFYSNRIKKTRKKKSKLPSPMSPKTDLSSTEPLSITGWVFRYDLKTAFFQECKQEIEGALKSYESAYNSIIIPLSSPGNFSITTGIKRLNEARILADCLNLKICKFYLYLNEPNTAASQLKKHLKMFESHASSWKIGKQTYEYWACISNQYQIFGDVVDEAVQAGFKIPMLTEYLVSSGSPQPGVAHTWSTTDCDPGVVIQHPGFYYHFAGMCCAERRSRFLDYEKSNVNTSDQFLAEKAFNHSHATVELLTKSYEQFKKYGSVRMTRYMAALIANMYYTAENYITALMYFNKVGQTYRKEKWNMVLSSILRRSLRCAKELKHWNTAVRCLVELMSDKIPVNENKRKELQTELSDILTRESEEAIQEPLVIHMDQITSFLECHVQIKSRKNFVGSHVDYQITLKTDKNSPPYPFRFAAVRVIFNNPQYNLILKDSDLQTEVKDLELIDFSNDLTNLSEQDEKHPNWFSADCDLRIVKGQTKVLQGFVLPKKCTELKITNITFDLISRWPVEINFTIDQVADTKSLGRRKWLEGISDSTGKPITKMLDGRGGLSVANILQKPPSIDLTFNYNSPALLDEPFKLDITVKNTEKEVINATLYAEIKNAEASVNEDYITFAIDDEDHSTKKECNLDKINTGKAVIKTAYLYGTKTSGSRIISLTVKYTVDGKETSEIVEKTETIRIPFNAPFDASFDLCALTEKVEKSIDIDLEKSEKWLLTTSLQCFSAWDLEIEKIIFNQDKTFTHPSTSLTLLSKMEELDTNIWKAGHAYNASYLFKIHTTDLTEEQPKVPTGSVTIKWRRSGTSDNYGQTTFSLPTIQLQQQGLIIISDVSSEIYLNEPFTLSYTIYNPTERIVDYSGSIEVSDSFIFSGYKQIKSMILPLSRKVYHYTCYPVHSGKVKLPKLKVMATRQQGGETEVPVEMVGTGPTFILTSDLQTKKSNSLDITKSSILTFVHPKRQLLY